jgi:hypothetical protein
MCRDAGDDDDYELEVAAPPYWQALNGILGRLRHYIELRLDGNSWDFINFIDFTVALEGVSTIRTFHSGSVPWETANSLISALASLPSLENVTMGRLTKNILKPIYSEH